MDTRNCSAGFASDRVMLYGSDFTPSLCDVHVSSHVALFSVMSLIRAMLCAMQFSSWRARRKKLQDQTTRKLPSRRLPLAPLLSLFSSCMLILFTILTSLDVANASNGGSLLLLALFYISIGVASLLLSIRLVKLGRKILPLSRMKLDASGASSERLAALTQATAFLKVIFLLDVIVIVLSPIAAIAGLFVPVYATFQVSIMSFVMQNLLLGTGLFVQLQRIVNAVRACAYSSPDVDTAAGRNEDMVRVIKKLRFQQALCCFFCPSTVLVWILCTVRVILPHYWMVAILFSMEIVGVAVIAFSQLPGKKGKRAKEVPTTEGDSPEANLMSNSNRAARARPNNAAMTSSIVAVSG